MLGKLLCPHRSLVIPDALALRGVQRACTVLNGDKAPGVCFVLEELLYRFFYVFFVLHEAEEVTAALLCCGQ